MSGTGPAPNCGPVYRRRRSTLMPLYPLVQHHGTYLRRLLTSLGQINVTVPRSRAGGSSLWPDDPGAPNMPPYRYTASWSDGSGFLVVVL